MFTNSFVPESRCPPKVFPVPMFPKIFPSPYVPQSPCSPVSIWIRCSPVLMFPKHVPQSRCSPVHVSPQPVHQSLCSPVLVFWDAIITILIKDIWATLPKWVPPQIQKWLCPIFMKMHRRIHCCINSVYSKYRHSMNGQGKYGLGNTGTGELVEGT